MTRENAAAKKDDDPSGANKDSKKIALGIKHIAFASGRI